MKHIILTLLVLVTSLPSIEAQADEEIERENLARFVKEIDFLVSEVGRIEKLSSTNKQMIFDYTSLRKDLGAMREGIKSYINRDINDGHVIKPIKGQY